MAGSRERFQGVRNEGLPTHDIQPGVGFKPFEEAKGFYIPPKEGTPGGDPFYVPETNNHYLYLRRPVTLGGMKGTIDIISEDNADRFADIIVAIHSGYRVFSDRPYENIDGGDEVVETNLSILRFSFLVPNPISYARLLTTYGIVRLGEDEFLLAFNFDENGNRERLSRVDSGEPVLVSEKNLFNLKKLQPLEESEIEVKSGEPQDRPDREYPGRIGFVDLPLDLATYKTVDITFYRYGGFKDEEYPVEPILPNREPLLLAR